MKRDEKRELDDDDERERKKRVTSRGFHDTKYYFMFTKSVFFNTK